MRIYFVTKNQFKIEELRSYFALLKAEQGITIDLQAVHYNVPEILHPDIDVIARFKAVEAFRYLGVPCVVEHGGLFMDALPGLPGGVGTIIWEAVGDRMCGFLHADDDRGAFARSVLAYCDGRRVRLYHGETRGRVADKACGGYQFNWDPIFLPEGSDQTYGEMGLEGKRASSQAIKAWKAFLEQEFPQEMGIQSEVRTRR